MERDKSKARPLAFAGGLFASIVLSFPSLALAAPRSNVATEKAPTQPRAESTRNATSRKEEPSGHTKTAIAHPRDAGRRDHAMGQKHPKTEPKVRGSAKHATPGHHVCQRAPVVIDRPELHEMASVALTDCDGKPRREAQSTLSSLARLRGTPRPKREELDGAADDGESVEHGVALMHHGLLERLQRISDQFPNKTISIVSGYRPQSDGSLHQRARAIDIRVEGIDNVTLVDFCRTLADSGCGYYPNSSFVHVDVRPAGSGKVTWIDASGPGEKPRYVSRWPETTSRLAPKIGSNDGDDPYIETPTVTEDPDAGH